MKVPFALCLRRISLPVRNFPRRCLGNAHGRNNLLSFLALRIGEIKLLFVPTQGGGMEIIMNQLEIASLPPGKSKISFNFFIFLSSGVLKI